MKRSVRLGAVLGVVWWLLFASAGLAVAGAPAGDGAPMEQARQNRQLYEQKRQAFEELFRRLDQRDSPLQTEGSPEWLDAYGQMLSATEEVMALCLGVEGCIEDERQGEMYRKLLVIGYADRAYVQLYGGGDRQAAMADLKRMTELERDDNESTRVIFWRGVAAAAKGDIARSEKALETLRGRGGEAVVLVEKLEKELADRKITVGR